MVDSNNRDLCAQGFTLVELMIVVAIIGILSAIAYPSYQRYIIQANRTDMMAEMSSMASRIETRRLVEGRYTAIALSQVFSGTVTAGTGRYPATNSQYIVNIWDRTVNPAAQMTGTTMQSAQWEIRATPINTTRMQNDGTLTLDYQGIKCRDLSTTTTADKRCGSGEQWSK